MEIVCDSCKATLNIPDDKLPSGQRVSVRCPRCKNKLVIDTEIGRPESPHPSDEGTEKTERLHDAMSTSSLKEDDGSSSEALFGFDDTEADSALDSYGEGEKPALVMTDDADRLESIKKALDDMGYYTIQAENTQEALSKMRFQNFDLVILPDLFDDISLEQSPILQYLNHLSMSVRRKMFVLLMSDTFRTMDLMMAFTMSANLVANWKDLGRLSSILGRAVSDNEKFYKVFMDTLIETGKA